MSALLENDYGKGKAYYVCADAEQSFYNDFYQKLVQEVGLHGVWMEEIPEGVEVTSRSGEKAEYIFLQNFNRIAVQVNLPEGKILFGNKNGRMEPLDNIVVKVEK